MLLRQAALSDPERLDPELLEKTVAEFRSQAPGQTGCALPGGDAELRKEVELRLRMERLLARITPQAGIPRNNDVSEYYRKHKDNFMRPEMANAAHIVKNVDERTSEESALAAMREIQTRLREGAEFAELADQHSDCPGRGGDLGYFPRGQMVDEFEAVVFKLAPGEISDVFRSPFGFHIAKLYALRPAGMAPLDDVRAEIEAALVRQKQERAIEQYVDKLRAKAEVKKAPRAEKQAEPTHGSGI